MILLSENAEKKIKELMYYPFTVGRHLSEALNTMSQINYGINHLPPPTRRLHRHIIPNIGTAIYGSIGGNILIYDFVWSTSLQKFYYVKSNFVRITSAGNIPSTHPSLYKECGEASYVSENGYIAVWRMIGNRKVYNFKNTKGVIISDIDFTQIKPFTSERNMTARGYTPDSRCYIIFDDGDREEINESKSVRLSQSDLRMIIESVIYRYKLSTDGRKKILLNEKYYNPFREPLIDGNLNGYDILEGAKEEQIICDLPEKGWVEDIRMYSMMRNQGKTFCLYRRVDNGKYFFVEVYDDPHDKEHLHGKAVPKKNVPDFILNDAISLIRHS